MFRSIISSYLLQRDYPTQRSQEKGTWSCFCAVSLRLPNCMGCEMDSVTVRAWEAERWLLEMSLSVLGEVITSRIQSALNKEQKP